MRAIPWLLPLLVSPSLLAQRVAEIEPNNSVATAQVVVPGTQVDADLVAGEQDWFSFTLAANTRVRVHTGLIDTRIALLDATGATYLAIDDDSRGVVNGWSSDITLNIAAGTYSVQVVGFTVNTHGAYSLEIATLTPVAYTGVESEPNDTPATATATTLLPGGSYYQGAIGPATPQLLGVAAGGSSTSVVNVAGSLVAGAWTPAVAGFGRHYLRFTSGANAGLSRQIAANSASSISCSAFPSAPAAGDAFTVELCDVDYFRVVLTAPTTGLSFAITEGDAPWVYGHRYEIYDAAGGLLAPTSSTSAPAFGANNGTPDPLLARTSALRVWPAGTYHIAVRSPVVAFAPATTMPNGVVPTGNYTLELFAMPMDTGPVVVEAAEPNQDPASATPIAPGAIGRGHITDTTGADTSDWWGPIAITQPTTIVFQTRPGTAPALGDSTIDVHDGLGTPLLSFTSGNLLAVTPSTSGLHARGAMNLTLLPGQVIYLEVKSPGAAASQGGNYELQIGTPVPSPYVTANYVFGMTNDFCGPAPRPRLSRSASSEVPLLGATFVRRLYDCPPAAIYVHMIGFSDTLYAGSVPLPLDLLVVGAPSCTLDVDPVLLSIGFADNAGFADILTPLPGVTALRGAVWYEQTIVRNPAANAFGVQVTNYGFAFVGERSY